MWNQSGANLLFPMPRRGTKAHSKNNPCHGETQSLQDLCYVSLGLSPKLSKPSSDSIIHGPCSNINIQG